MVSAKNSVISRFLKPSLCSLINLFVIAKRRYISDPLSIPLYTNKTAIAIIWTQLYSGRKIVFHLHAWSTRVLVSSERYYLVIARISQFLLIHKKHSVRLCGVKFTTSKDSIYCSSTICRKCQNVRSHRLCIYTSAVGGQLINKETQRQKFLCFQPT